MDLCGSAAFANLYAFKFFKGRDLKSGIVSTSRLFFKRNFPAHVIITAAISIVMTTLFFGGFTSDCPPQLVPKCVVGTIILMSIIVGFYETAFYMNALNKSRLETENLKRENVQAQLDILKNQVQPHFLFNSLNTLASIIPEEPGKAVQYVQKLSKVYRYVLEIKDRKIIPVEEELKCVQAYLFMLETRFGGNLKCDIDFSRIQPEDHIIPLSLQMLIENAVKHNVISTKTPLKISIYSNGKELIVLNHLQPKNELESSTGLGLKNISNRYDIIASKKVRVVKDETEFKVYLPLLKVELK